MSAPTLNTDNTNPMQYDTNLPSGIDEAKVQRTKKIATIALAVLAALVFVGCIAAAPFTGGLSLIGSAVILVIALTILGVWAYKENKSAKEENDEYDQMYNSAFERMANRGSGAPNRHIIVQSEEDVDIDEANKKFESEMNQKFPDLKQEENSDSEADVDIDEANKKFESEMNQKFPDLKQEENSDSEAEL